MVELVVSRPHPKRAFELLRLCYRHFDSSSRWMTVALLGLSSAGFAGDWDTQIEATPEVMYSDNICQLEDDRQSALVGLFTPTVYMSREGGKARASLFGSVQVNTLTDSRLEDLGCRPRDVTSAGSGQFSPRLNAFGATELVDDWLFFDADATISQNAANAFAPGGNDSLNRNGNTNTTYRYSLSPYIAHQFAYASRLDLRYTWDQQYNTVENVGESTRQRVDLRFGSIPGQSRYTWAIEADYDNIDYESTPVRPADSSELSSAQVDLGYQLNHDWGVDGFVGLEKNEFVSDFEETDGSYWDFGVHWTPNARTDVSVGTGERFFGSTPRLSIRYRHKRSTFLTKYAKTLTYDRQIRSRSTTGLPEDGGDVPPPGGDTGDGLEGDGFGDPTTRTTSPILDERFTLIYRFRGRRTGFNANASHSNQVRTQDGRESTFMSFLLSADRSLSRSTTLRSSLRWSERDPKGPSGDQFFYSETWRFTIEAERELAQNAYLGLKYQYIDRLSDQESGSGTYRENQINVSLRYLF